jgi:anti-sigma factor RsiW
VNCDAARPALEADPARTDAALAAHLQACPDCAAYRAELMELDERLRAALQVPVPNSVLRPRVAVVAARPRPRWTAPFALAASLGSVALLVGVLWSGFPRSSLAADVTAHMAHEPAAWSTTVPLPGARVAPALERQGVRLRPGVVDVTYVQTCWFRGRRVPHLVVAADGGPVTVMVLAGEPVASREAFEAQGYRGVLVPAERGGLAVLARDADAVNVEAVAARALDALQY